MKSLEKTEQADRRLFLKIKLINLADEARTIRRMEKRNPRLRNELWRHRTGAVRNEARHTILAYGFLRGRTLSQIGLGRHAPDWKKVEAMVAKYGPRLDDRNATPSPAETAETLSKFQEWRAS